MMQIPHPWIAICCARAMASRKARQRPVFGRGTAYSPCQHRAADMPTACAPVARIGNDRPLGGTLPRRLELSPDQPSQTNPLAPAKVLSGGPWHPNGAPMLSQTGLGADCPSAACCARRPIERSYRTLPEPIASRGLSLLLSIGLVGGQPRAPTRPTRTPPNRRTSQASDGILRFLGRIDRGSRVCYFNPPGFMGSFALMSPGANSEENNKWRSRRRWPRRMAVRQGERRAPQPAGEHPLNNPRPAGHVLDFVNEVFRGSIRVIGTPTFFEGRTVSLWPSHPQIDSCIFSFAVACQFRSPSLEF
jgi:hypothetical protein